MTGWLGRNGEVGWMVVGWGDLRVDLGVDGLRPVDNQGLVKSKPRAGDGDLKEALMSWSGMFK